MHRHALLVVAVILAAAGCNQRTPVLDGDVSPTAPGAVSPPPSNVVRIAFWPPGNRGGTTARGTVYLDTPASSDRVVTVQSSDESIVSVSPRQVVVPPGALSADFQLTTRPVTRDVNVAITASSGGGSIADYVSVWAPTTSFLSYTADRPNLGSHGQVVRWSSDAGTRFPETSCFDNSIVAVVRPPGDRLAILGFGAPPGHALRTGVYPITSDSPGGNTMAVPSDNCLPRGYFEVHEIDTRADRTLNNLWLTFEFTCVLKPGTMRGTFRVFNATPRTPSNRCLR